MFATWKHIRSFSAQIISNDLNKMSILHNARATLLENT